MLYYKLNDDKTISSMTIDELLKDPQKVRKRVLLTEIEGYTISTIFMSIDHNHTGEGDPVVFETMVFGTEETGWMDEYAERYTSYEEAIKGHQFAVNVCRESLDRGEPNLYNIAEELRDCL